MGVYIKGMEMPRNCQECQFWLFEIEKCRFADVKPDCPLVAVPDHGDLIDRDAVVMRLAEWSKRLIESYGENDEYVKCLSLVLEGLGYDDVVITEERSEA